MSPVCWCGRDGRSSFGRLYPRRLAELGFPTDPVAWYTVLGLLTLLVGAVALRLVEPHVDDVRTAPHGYVAACVVGALGLVGLASSIACGGAVALVAASTGVRAALLGCAALPALTVALILTGTRAGAR
ncbi:hypothetical protein ABZV93_05245 [Actinopolymorpha sp. NPDC004070]|uniref:hypothetical protein n=1 Tax=Actinopolymorpha sp. NPDC004070 TaxID=3154548 RepID=UPI0033AE917D